MLTDSLNEECLEWGMIYACKGAGVLSLSLPPSFSLSLTDVENM
jgi:hypothetical protein